MALVSCPDCSRQVSDVAPACPGCGRPMISAPTPRAAAPPPQVVAPIPDGVGCRKCGFMFAKRVGKCPRCGVAVPPSTKNIVIGVIVGLVLLVGLCGKHGSSNSENSAEPTPPRKAAPAAVVERPAAPREELIAVDAVRLWREYDNNEIAADQRYKRHRLIVAGVVDSIDKGPLGGMYFNLRTPNMFMHTMAKLEDSQETTAAQFSKGDRVKLECTCDGRVIGSPVLSSCVIQ